MVKDVTGWVAFFERLARVAGDEELRGWRRKAERQARASFRVRVVERIEPATRITRRAGPCED